MWLVVRSLAARRGDAPLFGVLALAIMLAVLGAQQAAGLLTGAARPAYLAQPTTSSSFAVSQDVPTSFGVVAVEIVRKLPGNLSAGALSGFTHGVDNLVQPDQVEIQTVIQITNLLNRRVSYAPDQFTLTSEKRDRPYVVGESNLPPGYLEPGANIEATLDFVIPADGSKLTLAFHDPGVSTPILIDLGQIDLAPKVLEPVHH